MGTRNDRKERFIQELEKNKGIVTMACHASGVPRSTFYKWCSEDKTFKAKVEETTEMQIDLVEKGLLTRILEGDTTAIIFYLKTKGRKRGYGEYERAKDTTIKVNVIEE